MEIGRTLCQATFFKRLQLRPRAKLMSLKDWMLLTFLPSHPFANVMQILVYNIYYES